MAAEAPPLPRHRPPVRAALPLPSTPVAGQTIQAPLMAKAARRAADPAEQVLPPWQVLLITAPARWVWFRSALAWASGGDASMRETPLLQCIPYQVGLRNHYADALAYP